MFRKIVLRDGAAARWMLFANPVDVLTGSAASDVCAVIDEAERRVAREGIYAAGFLTYEAAPAFDDAFVTRARGALPLICLGLFREPRIVQRLESPAADATAPASWRMSGSRKQYIEKIAAIKEQIARGNTYQVNYTVRQHGANVADAWKLFLEIASDAPYAAYMDCRDHAIVSASPELFFELDGEQLTCKPMKGTAARGTTQQDDLAKRERLLSSVKDRAENVMIADMVRNDLGRIAEAGSVRAAPLFEAEKYRTVWQMTSTVKAATRATLAEIFRALFPCASVTGAPKVASMKLIAELEDSAREIYTGAIGFLAPKRQARFCVAIRTALIDKSTGDATYGVGGGIVWDSDPGDEYVECLNKARVLSGGAQKRDFALLETLLWTPDDGYFLLGEHLERLSGSAGYFDFAFDRESVNVELETLAGQLPDRPCRIRLLLQRDGSLRLEHRVRESEAGACPLRVCLADQPVDVEDSFLYHKTTDRSLYERALSDAGDFDDVLLWNRDREVTESSIANVVVRMSGRLVTPPVECGLLPGTFRAKLLREGTIAEQRIAVDDLQRAEELFLINSVRGWLPCRVEPRALEHHVIGGKSITAS